MGFGHNAIARRVRAFVKDTRAGATAIASAAVTVMTVGGAALIVDHVWLYDQRDVLKTAAEAASIAATLDIDRQLAKNPRISDADLKAALEPVAKRYVLVNLAHLAPKRFKRARKSLEVDLALDRAQRTVGVTAKADLGGTLFSRNLPLLGNYTGPEKVAASAGVQSESTPVEVVLAIDVSGSMQSSLDRGVYDAGNNAIDNVKRAARELVDILDPNGYDRVAVGIVPWYAAVRLDTQSAEEWTDADWAAHVGTGSPPPAWQGCFNSHRRIYAGTLKAPAPTAADLFELPEDAPFAQAACEKSPLTQLPMPALLPLSIERTTIESNIDALDVGGGGGTVSTLGLLWGQRMLEPAWKGVWGGSGIHPANPATPEHAKLRKVIVLLTDGADSHDLNGISRAEACDAAKSKGTEIFVIAVIHKRNDTEEFRQALRDCSSESDREYPRGTRRAGTAYTFVNNTTDEQIYAAFTDIANQLRTLRKVS